jgi:hypothetical protein
MSKIEQELLRRALIDLFLASPRKRTHLRQQIGKEDPQKKTITTDKETKKQRTGDETNDQER